MKIKNVITTLLIAATALMGVGAFWQYTRYVALSNQYKAAVEANKGLAEAHKKGEAVKTATEEVSTKASDLVVDNNETTRKLKQQLASAVTERSADEKDVMASPLPAAVVRVLDDTYQSGNKAGTDP